MPPAPRIHRKTGPLRRAVVGLGLALPVLALAGIAVDRPELVFSGVQGTTGDIAAFTVMHAGEPGPGTLQLRIRGPRADAFRLPGAGGLSLQAGEAHTIRISFQPPAGVVGPLNAECQLTDSRQDVLATVALHGLSATGLEGGKEPPLRDALLAAGFDVDVGWETLANHVEPRLQGSEVPVSFFRRAGPGDVQLLPVARFSPDFLLPFGYYHAKDDRPELRPVGTLARASALRPEHNCLHPSLASGATAFDPGNESFGLFTASPTHVAYTDDAANARLEPTHVAHAVRVYPARDRLGQPIPHAYLVCFEEASNGDYQDYVFLLKNVVPAR